MLRRLSAMAIIGCALLLAACAGKDTPSSSAGATGAATATAAARVSSPAAQEPIPDHYDPSRDPVADLQAALALAAIDGKQILIDFGADWCPDCNVLDELFQSPRTKSLLQSSYHVVAVDVGEFDHNLDFAAKYVTLAKSGIPALVVLAPDGRVRVATNDGSFADARTMDSDQVDRFLTRWAPKR